MFESKKPLNGAILASRCPIAYGQAGEDGASQTLFVTPKTVEVHLSRAFRKLGVAGRRDLAAALAG